MKFYNNNFKGKLEYLTEDSIEESDRIVYDSIINSKFAKYLPGYAKEYSPGMGHRIYRTIYKRLDNFRANGIIDIDERNKLWNELKNTIDNYKFNNWAIDRKIYDNIIKSGYMEYAPKKYLEMDYEPKLGMKLHRAIYKRLDRLRDMGKLTIEDRNILMKELKDIANGKLK